MGWTDRLFQRLIRLFPVEFRADFGEEMANTFHEQHREAAAQADLRAHMRLWWDTVRGIVTTAPREHFDLLRQDVRYGLRNLRRQPGFTLVALTVLSIGIGASTAIFSIVNGVLLEPLPYADPQRLVTMFERFPGAPIDKFGFSAPDFEFLRGAARSFAGMAAYRSTKYELSGIDRSERINAVRVSPELFGVLGVDPAIGRRFTTADDAARAKVAILSAGLWNRAFHRDGDVLGRTIALDRESYTIVGVMPERFEFPPRGGTLNTEPAALYVPIAFTASEKQAFGVMYNNSVVARLGPGVILAQAQEDLRRTVPLLAARYPTALRTMAEKLELPFGTFNDEVVGSSRRLLLVLMGAVVMVLIICCADIANLMLTRSSARHRELAVRSALGATASRVLRQLLTEGVVLAVAAGICGTLLAYGLMHAFLSLADTSLPRVDSIRFDSWTVMFSAVVAFISPVLFGLTPALRLALRSSADTLKDGMRGVTIGRSRHRLLGSLIVMQFALALMLSVGAGLVGRSFIRLLATDPGFRGERAIAADVTLPTGRYRAGRDVKAFYQRTIDAARAIPGVTAVGAATDPPLNVRERRAFTPDQSARPVGDLSRAVANSWTAGDYFQALGIPLERGRFFSDDDGRVGEPVIVISHMLADKVWPGLDPIGRRIKWGLDVPGNNNPWMTVVGVVGDIKQGPLDSKIVPQTYEPIFQQVDDRLGGRVLQVFTTVNLVVRSDRRADAVITELRAAIERIDPALPVANAVSVRDVIGDSVRAQRFSTTLIGAFAGIALVLAAIGIYGVLSNVVAQQRQEIGVRVALGATTGSVLWMVLRRGLLLMGIGVAIGLPAALGLARVMSGLLYEVNSTDAPTFIGAALMLAVLALAAGIIPAWRATRVDPLTALRLE
jgi:putative ABC transport system permease protein